MICKSLSEMGSSMVTIRGNRIHCVIMFKYARHYTDSGLEQCHLYTTATCKRKTLPRQTKLTKPSFCGILDSAEVLRLHGKMGICQIIELYLCQCYRYCGQIQEGGCDLLVVIFMLLLPKCSYIFVGVTYMWSYLCCCCLNVVTVHFCWCYLHVVIFMLVLPKCCYIYVAVTYMWSYLCWCFLHVVIFMLVLPKCSYIFVGVTCTCGHIYVGVA